MLDQLRPAGQHALQILSWPALASQNFLKGGPAVCLWLEDGGVTLAEPMLRLASDVLWVQRGAEPREAKNQQNMAFHVRRIHVFLQDPMSRDPSGIKQNQTHTNTIPHLSLTLS